MESSILPILSVAALALMVVVTGGIAYLTTIEWRDRRREEGDKKQQRRPAKS